MRCRLPFLATSLLLLVPATALADDRVASPAGTGTSCSAAAPCALPTAFSQAVSGDGIVLRAGTYPAQTQTLTTEDGVAGVSIVAGADVHVPFDLEPGEAGLLLRGAGSALYGGGLQITAGATGLPLVLRGPVTATRADVRGGEVACDLEGEGGEPELSNALCVAGPAALRVRTGEANARFVTAVAQGAGGIAALADAGSGSATLRLHAVLADAPAGTGVVARHDPGGSSAISAVTSRYVTSSGLVGPVNPPASTTIAFATPVNFRLRHTGSDGAVNVGPSSPPSVDLDGRSRPIGAADIGAYEHQEATVAPYPHEFVTDAGALLAVAVNPEHSTGTVSFRLTEIDPANPGVQGAVRTFEAESLDPTRGGPTDVGRYRIEQTVTGLTPGTTYQVDPIVSTADGSFLPLAPNLTTTGVRPVPTPPPGPGSPVPAPTPKTIGCVVATGIVGGTARRAFSELRGTGFALRRPPCRLEGIARSAGATGCSGRPITTANETAHRDRRVTTVRVVKRGRPAERATRIVVCLESDAAYLRRLVRAVGTAKSFRAKKAARAKLKTARKQVKKLQRRRG